MQPVFRFAPSPNGPLHLGHALSALINSDLAKQHNGRFLLRIEDIDVGRSRQHFIDGIFRDLDWLGLSWETPVRHQSAYFDHYRSVLADLADRGFVYPCFCTRHEVASAALGCDPDGAPVYAGTCRQMLAADRQVATGKPHQMRLDMEAALRAIGGPPTFTAWDPESNADTIIETDPARWGDVVLGRKDVPTSYHLAVVVDDAAQGITHVVRGSDLAAATDIHRVLQVLLGLPAPRYHHHRLIRDGAGEKLAKSQGATALSALREQGVTPADIRAMVGL